MSEVIRTAITKSGKTTERSGTGAITLTLTSGSGGMDIFVHVQTEIECTKEEAIAGVGELLAHLEVTHGSDFVAQCLRRYAKEVVPLENKARWTEERKRSTKEAI